MDKKEYSKFTPEFWGIQKLQDTIQELNSLVNVIGCFGTKDVYMLELCLAELRRRGYEIEESKKLKFKKV